MPRLRFTDLESVVERRCPSGHPQVLRCHPARVVAGRVEPFPTLFWLVCPAIIYELAQLETRGFVRSIQAEIERDPEFRARVAADHQRYITERDAALTSEERAALDAAGILPRLHRRGIGGILDPASVKCLHLHYAHHLARGSAIGARIDELRVIVPCAVAPGEGDG